MPQADVDTFLKNLPSILEEYEAEDIFNADETALYYTCMPRRTLANNHNSAFGGKNSKDRLTLLLCCSMSGEKLPPLVVGKYKNPRCFRGVDVKQLPCAYHHSQNAWMNTTIFQEWLANLDQKMLAQRRRIILFVDNATPHRIIREFFNIRVAFLPPKCTSLIQPIDQGVIWSLKCKFRRLLLEHVISDVDNDLQSAHIKKIHVLQALHFVKRAWSDVHPDVIINAFSKAGFQEKPILEINDEPVCEFIDDFFSYVKIDETLFNEELQEIDVDKDDVSPQLAALFYIVLGSTFSARDQAQKS